MLRRYPWLSLVMLLVVGTSTAYAVGQALAGDWRVFHGGDSDTVIYNVPMPTEAEVSDIKRQLSPKIEIEEPLQINING
jgi:hypothetical protein